MTYSTEELETIFKGLDAECWQCGGDGEAIGLNEAIVPCDICNGAGRQPTRAGIELLNFLERHRERVRGSVERAEIARKGAQ